MQICIRMEVLFDRHAAIKLSGVSEKAYNRSFNAMQNGIGVKSVLICCVLMLSNFSYLFNNNLVMCRNKLDVRELAIQFGCVRLIPFVHKGLSL